jgi:hypothetical protein
MAGAANPCISAQVTRAPAQQSWALVPTRPLFSLSLL